MINKRPRRRSFRRSGRTVCILNAGSPMCMKSVICMLLLLCTSLFTYIDAEAQAANQVTGGVTDATTNATLPNVNIIVEGSEDLTGSMIGKTTTIDGEYSIQIAQALHLLGF